MLEGLRQKIAAMIAPKAGAGGRRMYAAAAQNRLTADWNALNTSADTEIVTSLRVMRARSRQLIRDNDHAKNGVRIVQNNVVGTGINLQANVKNQRGKLVSAVNDQIECAYRDWWNDKKRVHTGGLLSGPDIERMIIGNLVENGEAIVRIVRKKFGDSKVALALELIESDRLIETWSMPRSPAGNYIRMGVEVDEWGRPITYWMYPTHPGDYQFSQYQPASFMQVPAEQIIHLYIVDRWPQTRGVPWFNTAMRRLNNMGGYEEAEIVAARGSASIMGFITSPEAPPPDAVQDGQRVEDMSPGLMKHLLPGEQFTGFNPSRPNGQADPFMRLMLRGVAAGIGVSYESLSRDYSQSNYSSSRLSLLDDRDLWRILQGWLIRNFRQPLHREFMDAAILGGALSIPDYYSQRDKYQDAVFKPRGWSWIDPSKEVLAYQLAVRNGFMTVSDVIGLTGNGADAEDVFKRRREELDTMADLELVFDSDPAQVNDKGIAQPNQPAAEAVDANAQGQQADPDGDGDAGKGEGTAADDAKDQAAMQAASDKATGKKKAAKSAA